MLLITPRYQSHTYIGELNVNKVNPNVPLQLDLSEGYNYSCSHGVINDKILTVANAKNRDDVFVYQYKN